MQSAALGISLRSILGDLDPCNARVGGCIRALAVTSIASIVRVGRFHCGLGGVRSRRRSILIVDRLYYRIIRHLCLLFFCCFRCTLLFLCFLFLYICTFSNLTSFDMPSTGRTSFSISRSFASRSFLSLSRNSRSDITQAGAPSTAASGRDLFFNRSE